MAKSVSTKRAKAGTSKGAAAARKVVFAHAFICNGMNGDAAAVTAGFSPKTAGQQASRLLKDVKVQALIAEATEKAAKIAGLSVERTLREIARLAYSDPRKLYRPDGSLLPVTEMDDDTAATVASVEVDEIKADGGVVGHTRKVKHWDKNSALEKAMRYHGLYGKDNEQKGDAAVAALLAAVGLNASKFNVKP